MNFGDCPYDDCDELIMLDVPDVTPVYAPVECSKCGRRVWYRFSRIDPEAWTEADFLAAFVVDDTTHSITPREATQ